MPNNLDQAVSNSIAGAVSGPVDLITWLLRKTGVPIEKPVLGSDWMREKGLTKDIEQGPSQVVGETIGNLVDPFAPVAKAGKLLEAALYAGALRKDLLAHHSITNLGDMFKHGKLTSELMNPSFAITSNKIEPFESGRIVLIPREGVLDPKTANTTLFAFDGYTPRRSQALSAYEDPGYKPRNADTLSPEALAAAQHRHKKNLANKRLVDRFLPVFPKGGMSGESTGKTKMTELPRYGLGSLDPSLYTTRRDLETARNLSYGPRFQSFKHYETSPYGAERLTSGTSAYDITHDLATIASYYYGTGLTIPDILRGIASDKYGTPSERTRVRELLEAFKRTRSDYGELKQFGPLGLHPGNFGGALVNNYEKYNPVVQALRERGLPVVEVDDIRNPDSFEVARALSQNKTQTKVAVPQNAPALTSEELLKFPKGSLENTLGQALLQSQ